jgi:superfamily II DNA helicase RecQ
VNVGPFHSTESFLQRAGRAGRRGQRANIIVLYSNQKSADQKSDYKDKATELILGMHRCANGGEIETVCSYFAAPMLVCLLTFIVQLFYFSFLRKKSLETKFKCITNRTSEVSFKQLLMLKQKQGLMLTISRLNIAF